MANYRYPVAAMIDRAFSVFGWAILAAVFGAVVLIVVDNLTDPPFELGWFRSIACGAAGCVFGLVLPRVGAATCEIVSYVLPW